jgi:hypothetical protein
VAAGATRPIIGAQWDLTATFPGYISGFSIQKGVAKYTAAFTPPTSPQLTGDYSQSLLLNAYPAIYDTTRRNAIETVGSYSGANGGPPYGARAERYSHYFNGTNDYLNIPNSPDLELGTGDFTIETWLYLAGNSALSPSNARTATIIGSKRPADGYGWAFHILASSSTTGTGLYFDHASATSAYSGFQRDFAISQSVWHHIAVVRKDGNMSYYFNGVQQGTSASYTKNFVSESGSQTWIGAQNAGAYTHYLNGYLYDLRVTKGFARYTANFKLANSPLPIK